VQGAIALLRHSYLAECTELPESPAQIPGSLPSEAAQ
jgi:hypothetical protein